MIGRSAVLGSLVLALAAGRSDPLAGRIAGPAQECIDITRTNGPEIVDDRTILYRQNARRIWRTGPIDRCEPLRSRARLIVEVYGRKVCENDRFQVVYPDAIAPSAYCRFGAFTPYDKR